METILSLKGSNQNSATTPNKSQELTKETQINPSDKPYYLKYEKPIELDFQEAIIRFDTFKDFSKWAEFVGVKISPNKRKEAYRYIQTNLKSLEC